MSCNWSFWCPFTSPTREPQKKSYPPFLVEPGGHPFWGSCNLFPTMKLVQDPSIAHFHGWKADLSDATVDLLDSRPKANKPVWERYLKWCKRRDALEQRPLTGSLDVLTPMLCGAMALRRSNQRATKYASTQSGNSIPTTFQRQWQSQKPMSHHHEGLSPKGRNSFDGQS